MKASGIVSRKVEIGNYEYELVNRESKKESGYEIKYEVSKGDRLRDKEYGSIKVGYENEYHKEVGEYLIEQLSVGAVDSKGMLNLLLGEEEDLIGSGYSEEEIECEKEYLEHIGEQIEELGYSIKKGLRELLRNIGEMSVEDYEIRVLEVSYTVKGKEYRLIEE